MNSIPTLSEVSISYASRLNAIETPNLETITIIVVAAVISIAAIYALKTLIRSI